MPISSTTGAVSPVKARFFIYFMVFFAAVSAFTVVTNLLLGLPFYLNYKWIAISVMGLGLAAWAYRGARVALILRLGVYLSAFAVFPVSWMASAGLTSPAITYAVLVIVMINYLLTGWERVLVNAFYIGLVLVMISVFYFQPHQFTELTATEQYLDWIINVPIVLGFLAFMLTLFERAYERERQYSAEKTDELHALTVTDALTGLANRLGLNRELARALATFRRTGDRFSLIFLDVDHFKAYNDYYGHAQGDACLREVADCIRRGLRREATDFAFRFGGEEFVILLLRTDTEGAVNVANRVRDALAQVAIPHAGAPTHGHVTLSMGIAEVCIERSTSDAVLAAADEALYAAKAAGRDRIILAEPPAAHGRSGGHLGVAKGV